MVRYGMEEKCNARQCQSNPTGLIECYADDGSESGYVFLRVCDEHKRIAGMIIRHFSEGELFPDWPSSWVDENDISNEVFGVFSINNVMP
jgi:hypothetical protein